MVDDKLNDIFTSLGNINGNIISINTTLQKVDRSLNDEEVGLKTRTALLEASDGRRTWKERAIFTALLGLLGLVVTLILIAI